MSIQHAMSAVALSALLWGCITEDELPDEGGQTLEGDEGVDHNLFAADPEGLLQVYRSGSWQNVGPDGVATSTTASQVWYVNSDRRIYRLSSSGQAYFLSCGETWGTNPAPRTCTVERQRNGAFPTTYHCTGGAGIKDCIFGDSAKMFVDNANTVCIGYTSTGQLKSVAASSTSCKSFRIYRR